jgi:enoyl-CoA hydratase
MSIPYCRVTRAGSAAILTLDRPEKHNAISLEMRVQLAGLLTSLDSDAGVRTIIVTGVDPAFSGGVDLDEIATVQAPGAARPPHPGTILGSVATPVIAAVNGDCYTGALELVLACDFAIASELAVFAETHARYGLLFGWGGSARLPRAVGLAFAKEMSLTGRPVGAAEALRVGLVNEVVPHDRLLPRAIELAVMIASCDEAALQAVLDLYDAGAGMSLADQLQLERSFRKDRALARARATRRWAERDRGRQA